jgi:arylsulfatase A-like enzyme
LCCPSRASILRGQYVHNHGVRSNLPPNGGFEHWQELGDDTSSVATWLHDAGYKTALFGKYLNGYPDTVAPTYVPPGWDQWASPSAGNPYSEYNYQLNENGTLERYGQKPSDYLVDVLAQKSKNFIASSSPQQPFFLYVAPYVPHQPATPAPRYANAFPDYTLPKSPSYDQADVSAEPAYVKNRPLLTPAQVRYINGLALRRVRSMLAVEDLLRTIVDSLAAAHQLENTYIVFTSDNGFHLGQHRLPFGKQTPFEEDIHVPLVVRGPGVPAGKTVRGFAREIDLAPTFAALAGAKPASFVDGMSLVPALHNDSDAAFPRDVLIEHFNDAGTRAGRKAAKQADTTATDPDDDADPPAGLTPQRVPKGSAVGIPSYGALRTSQYMYASYDTGEKQLYDLRRDPNELHNLVATADPALLRTLDTRLTQLEHCRAATCRT